MGRMNAWLRMKNGFTFIIEQLLSNAVKYTPEGGTVTISVDDMKQLSVTDTGIGISPEDLPRIFEKGYTGYNGRLDKKSNRDRTVSVQDCGG